MAKTSQAFVVFLLALLPAVALAVEVAGVRFPERVTIDGTPLVINGTGIRRVTIFKVKVYAAGLYVRERTRVAAEILRADRPKYFVAVMKRDVSREDSARAFREAVERSAGRDVASLRSEIAAFTRWIPAMRENQRLTVFFNPDVGVVVKSTAKTEAFRASAAFGTALLGMWIGPRAVDARLRESLLGGESSSGA